MLTNKQKLNSTSPLTALVVPSNTMESSSQGRGFQVRTVLTPSSPPSEMYGVFNIRVSPLSFGKQPRAMTIG